MSNTEGIIALILMIVGFWLARKWAINASRKKQLSALPTQLLGIVAGSFVSFIVVPMLMIILFTDKDAIDTAQTTNQETVEQSASEIVSNPPIDPAAVDLSQAKPYQVISDQDISARLIRPRHKAVIIAPEASNFEQFAQTAMKAAIELRRNYQADVMHILLAPNKTMSTDGQFYATALFAPDNGGISGDQGWTWEVKAVEQPFTEQAIKTHELWYQHKNSYQVNGETDEPALVSFIANKLNASEDDIYLPIAWLETYTPTHR